MEYIDVRILNNAGTLAPRVANWALKFSALGPIHGHKVQQLLVIGTDSFFILFFSISAFTPSVNPLGLISTFAPIGMLDLGRTLTLTPSVKRALRGNYIFCMHS